MKKLLTGSGVIVFLTTVSIAGIISTSFSEELSAQTYRTQRGPRHIDGSPTPNGGVYRTQRGPRHIDGSPTPNGGVYRTQRGPRHIKGASTTP